MNQTKQDENKEIEKYYRGQLKSKISSLEDYEEIDELIKSIVNHLKLRKNFHVLIKNILIIQIQKCSGPRPSGVTWKNNKIFESEKKLLINCLITVSDNFRINEIYSYEKEIVGVINFIMNLIKKASGKTNIRERSGASSFEPSVLIEDKKEIISNFKKKFIQEINEFKGDYNGIEIEVIKKIITEISRIMGLSKITEIESIIADKFEEDAENRQVILQTPLTIDIIDDILSKIKEIKKEISKEDQISIIEDYLQDEIKDHPDRNHIIEDIILEIKKIKRGVEEENQVLAIELYLKNEIGGLRGGELEQYILFWLESYHSEEIKDISKPELNDLIKKAIEGETNQNFDEIIASLQKELYNYVEKTVYDFYPYFKLSWNKNFE